MTWDEAVKQHVDIWKAKEANVPRGMISVCTYDDFLKPSNLKEKIAHHPESHSMKFLLVGELGPASTRKAEF